MATTTWPEVLVWARSTIEGVVPEVEPARRFRICDGFRMLIEEPPPTFHRGVVVEGGGGESGNFYGARVARDVRKELVVSIGYHANMNRKTLEEQMGRDEEQIISALLKREGVPVGISLVEWTDTIVDRMPVPEDPDRHVVDLQFRITYRTRF